MVDITDELKKQDVYDKINPNILDIISKDGRVYMYPTTAYVLGMGCNIDLMKEAGLVMATGLRCNLKHGMKLLSLR